MSEHKLGGWIPSEPDPRDYRLVYGAYEYAALPEEWTPPADSFAIHDQGQINSCVGHAIAGQYEVKGNPAMAYGWIYGNRRYTDYRGEGLNTREALKTVQNDGVPPLPRFPYDEEVPEIIRLFEKEAEALLPEARERKIGNYYRLSTADECRRAMFEGKCVVLGLFLLDGMMDTGAGTDPMVRVPAAANGIQMLGGHLVGGFGWDRRGIRFANSWSEKWGENGFGYLEDGLFGWSEQHGFPIPLVEAWAFELGKEPEKRETGWYQQDGKWRYRDADGSDHVGWLETWTWFYLDADGNMATSWQKIDGVWYYFNASGAMQTGWLYDGSKDVWYYLTNSGGMAVGWKKIEGKWYYFNGSGAMVTGLQSITGKQYYFFERSQGGHLRGEMLLTDGAGAIQ